MLAFYNRQEFGRSLSVAIHDEGETALRVIRVINGKTTVNRVHQFADPAERAAYLDRLDADLAAARFASKD